ncbi:hypothetical protein K439DRAFT_1660708 [Ramaria rubella]|nr:hypothetical protein K439DRAFT_1660708 [Ramaria rubella]
MAPRTVNLVRYGLLGGLLACSIKILGLSGSILNALGPTSITGLLAVYAQLALAVAVISLVVVVPSIIIDFFRVGSFVSMVVVELSWSFILMILWIAAAGQATNEFSGVDCSDIPSIYSTLLSYCRQSQALEAFVWIGFLILLSWLTTLVSLAATAHNRGNTRVWMSSVTGTDFTAHLSSPSVQGGTPSIGGYPQSIPMQQQQFPNYLHGQPSAGYPTLPPRQCIS